MTVEDAANVRQPVDLEHVDAHLAELRAGLRPARSLDATLAKLLDVLDLADDLRAEVERVEVLRVELADEVDRLTEHVLPLLRRDLDDMAHAKADLESLARKLQGNRDALLAQRNTLARECADLRDERDTAQAEAAHAREERAEMSAERTAAVIRAEDAEMERNRLRGMLAQTLPVEASGPSAVPGGNGEAR